MRYWLFYYIFQDMEIYKLNFHNCLLWCLLFPKVNWIRHIWTNSGCLILGNYTETKRYLCLPLKIPKICWQPQFRKWPVLHRTATTSFHCYHGYLSGFCRLTFPTLNVDPCNSTTHLVDSKSRYSLGFAPVHPWGVAHPRPQTIKMFIWVSHERPIWRISVRLSDRSKVTQHKINFVKNYPQWGLNSQPPDHQSHALPTVLSHYLVVGVNQQGLYKVILYWF